MEVTIAINRDDSLLTSAEKKISQGSESHVSLYLRCIVSRTGGLWYSKLYAEVVVLKTFVLSLKK